MASTSQALSFLHPDFTVFAPDGENTVITARCLEKVVQKEISNTPKTPRKWKISDLYFYIMSRLDGWANAENCVNVSLQKTKRQCLNEQDKFSKVASPQHMTHLTEP